jgi:hypothetical protein
MQKPKIAIASNFNISEEILPTAAECPTLVRSKIQSLKPLRAKVDVDTIGINRPAAAIFLAIARVDDVACPSLSDSRSTPSHFRKHTGTKQTSCLVRERSRLRKDSRFAVSVVDIGFRSIPGAPEVATKLDAKIADAAWRHAFVGSAVRVAFGGTDGA